MADIPGWENGKPGYDYLASLISCMVESFEVEMEDTKHDCGTGVARGTCQVCLDIKSAREALAAIYCEGR